MLCSISGNRSYCFFEFSLLGCGRHIHGSYVARLSCEGEGLQGGPCEAGGVSSEYGSRE